MESAGKIFVAGHNGMVGSALMRKLREQGYSNLLTASHQELDLRRQADVEAFFFKNKPDYVFLGAAKVGGILANSTYKAEFIYDNLSIATNVIEAAYRNGVKKLLNLGSSCIFPRMAPQPLKESSLLTGPLETTNEPYAIAKIAAIKLCRYYNEQYGTDYLSAMPTNLYGPRDNYDLEKSHVLPALIRKFHLAQLLHEQQFDSIREDIRKRTVGFGLQLHQKSDTDIVAALGPLGITANTVALWGSGQPFREFLYVDDLADALVFLMQKHHASEIGEFVSIGTGIDLQISQLAQLVRTVVNFKGDIVYDSSRLDGTPQKLLDVTHLNRLGWKASTSLEEGLRKTYDWYLRS
ncbi:MAG: GDP-L-fucose synthase [Ignavibacteriales bacterium]|nr:GDP-L-fucose synthase [Ignavibacteriales bacterium]